MPATGDQLRVWKLQGPDDETPNWGSLSVSGNYLVATSSPVAVGESSEATNPPAGDTQYQNIIARHETWRYLAGSDPVNRLDRFRV